MFEVFCISSGYNSIKLALFVNSIITTLHTASSTSSQNFPKNQETFYFEKISNYAVEFRGVFFFLLLKEISLKIMDGHHELILPTQSLYNKGSYS